MKITLATPASDYAPVIDTNNVDVTITEAPIGVEFVSEAGEHLSICMRDSGFDVSYRPQGTASDQLWSFQNGTVETP